MRGLLLWADDESANLGVRVLAAGNRALLRQVAPNIHVDSYLRPYPDGPAPLYLGYRAMAEGILRRSAAASEWLASYDVIIDTGGGDSFADIYGLDRLTLLSALRWCAARSGTPVILGPQTIGPFDSRRGRLLGRTSVIGTRTVLARDSRSQIYASERLKLKSVLSSDVVFALPGDVPARPRTDVLFNVSGLLWSSGRHGSPEAYRTLCQEVVEKLASNGLRVSILCHVLANDSPDQDVSAGRELAERLKPLDLDVIVPDGLDDARGHIAAARLVIGARMHACLNALSLGVPAVPLAYSRKFGPLMADLGWAETVELQTAGSEEVVARSMRLLRDSGDASGVADRGRRLLEPALNELRRVMSQ